MSRDTYNLGLQSVKFGFVTVTILISFYTLNIGSCIGWLNNEDERRPLMFALVDDDDENCVVIWYL